MLQLSESTRYKSSECEAFACIYKNARTDRKEKKPEVALTSADRVQPMDLPKLLFLLRKLWNL